MSGLEVAGVVLGAVPVILEGIEIYLNAATTTKRYWRYKSELRKTRDAVRTEHALLLNTLQLLLSGVVPDDRMNSCLKGLPKHGGSMIWSDPAVEAKLRIKLRWGYDLYVSRIDAIHNVLRRFMEKLGLTVDGEVLPSTDVNMLKEEFKKLKFMIKKAEYAALLDELKDHNRALTEMTQHPIRLSATQIDTPVPRPNFKAFQHYAAQVYSALRYCWPCSCNRHTLDLQLEAASTDDGEGKLLSKLPLRVMFRYDADSPGDPGSQVPWNWKEAEIGAFQERLEDRRAASPSQTPQIRLKTSQTNCATAPSVSHSAEVLNKMLSQKTQANGFSHTLPVLPSVPAQAIEARGREVQNLCKDIADLREPHRRIFLGYLHKPDESHDRYGIYVLEKLKIEGRRAISLGDILNRQPAVPRPMSTADKFRLAVYLANTILKFHRTPWLDEQWGRNQVLFIQQNEVSVYDHPFVSCRFPTAGNATASKGKEASKDRSDPYGFIRNQALFTLGVLLIELWYGKPLDDLRDVVGVQDTTLPSWCTAIRLVDSRLKYEAGALYTQVVRRCVRCDFDRDSTSLNDEGFQQIVYEKVVLVLEKNLAQFNGNLK